MGTLEPGTTEALSAMVRDAAAARSALVPVGGQTKLRTLPPSAASASLLSTRSLPATIDHVPGDLVATVSAGVALAELNRVLAAKGQCLPLDPPFAERATIGGVVAANDSGPRRHRYGAPRDLIIGISMVLADGREAKAGGRVVKNVAGYDLSRLMCGSLGSLAVITSATFKLSPIPAASITVSAELTRPGTLGDLVQALVNAPLAPSAIEVIGPPTRLLVRFESTRTAADHMARAASAICERFGAPASLLAGDDEAAAWKAAEASIWGEPGTVVKLSVLPTDVAYAVDEAVRSCRADGVDLQTAGRAALGVLFFRLNGDPSRIESLIAGWRHRATVGGGSLVVSRAAAGLARVSAWGESIDAMPVMRAVKSRFDPHGVFSPGLGPGGL
jgi:glycolate oxidase FAD binding subunit